MNSDMFGRMSMTSCQGNTFSLRFGKDKKAVFYFGCFGIAFLDFFLLSDGIPYTME